MVEFIFNSWKLEVLLVTLVSIHLQFESSCAQTCSYFQEQGDCKLFKDCNAAQELWAKAKAGDKNLLKDLQTLTRACSYTQANPKVCCPSPVDKSGTRILGATTTTVNPFQRTQPVNQAASAARPSGDNFASHPNFRLLPSIDQCSSTPLSQRIVGGKAAPLGSYPWLARIGYLILKSGRIVFGCAGSVVTDKTIVTAAHCLENLGTQLRPAIIRLAEHNVNTNPDCVQQECVSHQDFEIDRIILHPNYHTNSKHNDIAIIHIKGRIPFDKPYVKPVCLPFINEYSLRNFPNENELNHRQSIVAGFGKTRWNRAAGSSILQHVELTIQPNGACQDSYARTSRIQIIPSQLCAAGEPGKDSCDGDSGGPLMIFSHVPGSRLPKLFQVGIISYGPKECGLSHLPGVYTRVTEFRRWILDNLAVT